MEKGRRAGHECAFSALSHLLGIRLLSSYFVFKQEVFKLDDEWSVYELAFESDDESSVFELDSESEDEWSVFELAYESEDEWSVF